MDRAALYARVSSEEQVDGYSIDAQKRAYRALCKSKEWESVKEYVDEGKSAHNDNIDSRPEFKKIVSDAIQGKFDVLVVHKLDRFSRNLRTTIEYFDKLQKAGVSFVSISEQMDFTSPIGKVQLALLGAFAQYYSDNLSQETKKGWAERRAQGLYCGLLPFGVIKGDDGIPTPHPETYPGLVMAFELAAQGGSDTRIAKALNTAGYRTTGNQGSNLFSNNTIRGLLTNRFYLGYITDGNGGWLDAKHKAMIDEKLWNRAQDVRKLNATSTHSHCTQKARICSLSGITYCWYCKGRIHVACTKKGKPRLGCYNRIKGWECNQKSASLAAFEEQIRQYLGTFYIPQDYQEKILEAHRKLQNTYSDAKKPKVEPNAKLERVKDLYKWGDITEKEYHKEKQKIQQENQQPSPVENTVEDMEKLAEFLASIGSAWDEANQEQRNKLTRCLFQTPQFPKAGHLRPGRHSSWRGSFWLPSILCTSPEPVSLSYPPHRSNCTHQP